MRRLRIVVQLATLLAITAIAAPPGLAQDAIPGAGLDLIQQRVSQLRHLDFSSPVRVEIVSRDRLRSLNTEMFFRDNTQRELDAEQTLLETLGYIPPGVDMVQVVLNLLGDEVDGFYDTVTKTIYVVSDEAENLDPSAILAIAHEYTHALLDQNFDLKANEDARRANSDQTLAFQALVQGDAGIAQALYAGRYLYDRTTGQDADSETSDSSFLQAPLILRRELMFPEDNGVDFVVDAFLDGAWGAVDDLWANPPASTAQVLHPEKYLAGQGPVTLPLPDVRSALGPGWTELDENTLGELDIRTLIEQYSDRDIGERAAEGWAGDDYALLRRDSDGAAVFAMRTVWDTVDDAKEFATAYQLIARARHGAKLERLPAVDVPVTGPAPDTVWAATGDNVTHVLIRDGKYVALVVATDPIGLSIAESLRPTSE